MLRLLHKVIEKIESTGTELEVQQLRAAKQKESGKERFQGPENIVPVNTAAKRTV